MLIVAASHLPHLVHYLSKHLPRSYRVHSFAKAILHGTAPWLHMVVDDWPNPDAVICQKLPGSEETTGLHNVAEYEIFYDSHSNNNMCYLASCLTILCDWTKPAILRGYNIFPAIRECAIGTGSLNLKQLKTFCATQPIEHIPLPLGYNFTNITTDDAENVTSIISKCTHEIPNRNYIRAIITSFPSAGIKESSGKLASFCLTHPEGMLCGPYNTSNNAPKLTYAVAASLISKLFKAGWPMVQCDANVQNDKQLQTNADMFSTVSSPKLLYDLAYFMPCARRMSRI